MEKIKAYQQIESFVSEALAKQIAEELELNENDLGIRLRGKDSEYDFLFRCYSLGEIEKILAFEEGVSRLTETVTVDFLFFLKNGRRLAIEVKTKLDPTKPITSAKILTKQRELAESLYTELFYAVFINGTWRLHSADYVESHKRIIPENSILASEMNILGERLYLFSHPIQLRTYYRQRSKKTLLVKTAKVDNAPFGMKDINFGYVEKYVLQAENKTVLTVNRQNAQDHFIIILVLRALFIELGKQQREVVSQKNGRTLLIDTSKRNIIVSLSDLLIERVYNLWQGRNKTANPRQFITHLVDQNERDILKSGTILDALAYVNKKGMDIKVYTFEEEGKKWIDFTEMYPERLESNELFKE